MRLEPERAFVHDCGFAERTIIEHGALRPMAVVHGRERMAIVTLHWTDDEEKSLMMSFLRLLAVAEDADAISMMMEAWTLRGAALEEFTKRGIRPSESGKRVEVVQVAMIWRDASDEMRHRISIRDIQRRAGGKVSGLAPAAHGGDEPDRVEGRMMELLPERSPSPELRATAREMLEHWKRMMPMPPMKVRPHR